MYRVKKELYLCPVALAAKIVQRVRSYPGSDDPEERTQFSQEEGNGSKGYRGGEERGIHINC